MTKTRKVNSIRNVVLGLTAQGLYLLLNFICRTILIWKLGRQVLAINGLYSNILSLLSIAELGIGNIFLFSLYKPLAENDTDKVNQIIHYYKKLYNAIALIVLIIGLCVMPFLKYLISSDITISLKNLNLYYIVFLANSVFSYLLVYKRSLINADQKNYIIKICGIIFDTLLYTLQIAFLFWFKSYLVYLITSCVVTLLQNITINIIADHKYPYIKQKPFKPIEQAEKSNIKRNIVNTFFYKIGNVILNNTDAILISTIVSTLEVGYYSNYNMVINALNGLINIIVMAIFASVGNLATENDAKKSLKIFNVMTSTFIYIAMFCSLCLIACFNDFITIWIGAEYLLDIKTVVVIAVTFYINTAVSSISMFRENYGLFKEVKWLMISAAIINIGLSIWFGKLWGMFGILLATIVSKLFTTLSIEPLILYKNVFKVNPAKYYIKQILFFAAYCGLTLLILYLNHFIPAKFIFLLVKVAIIFIAVSGCFVLFFFKTDEFKYLVDMAKEVLFKKKK